MKLKLWYFINKHAILKKLFFWIFPLLGMSVAKAETIYQCTPCPSGLSSNPGAVGSGACFNPVTKGGASVIFNGAGNYSGTLQPGWYRIAIRGANGSSNSCDNRHQNCNAYGKNCTTVGNNCTGSGGTGGSTYYVFYVSVAASYSHIYNNGSPKLTITESGKTRTFAANKGTNGAAANNCTNTGAYGSCVQYTCQCSNGSAGASNQVSGLFSNDKSSSNVDGLGSAGGKLTKL